MAPKPCLGPPGATGCPTRALAPSGRSRCPACARALERGRVARRPQLHSRIEIQRRRQAVAKHKAIHGNWCPGWGCGPHPAADLTADHPRAVSQGGIETQPLEVLCRSCNASKGARS